MSSISIFFNKYKYMTDKEQYGIAEYWEEPKLNEDGMYVCDCESVAIWIKKNVAMFDDWDYYWCRLNGEGHCILVSPCGSMMIDNNTKKVTLLSQYERMYTITELRPYTKLELLWKFGSAKVLKLWFQIKG
jgi:predicted transglutaminase-like cysteine proteinase